MPLISIIVLGLDLTVVTLGFRISNLLRSLHELPSPMARFNRPIAVRDRIALAGCDGLLLNHREPCARNVLSDADHLKSILGEAAV
jgi:hypothetical protein